MFQHFLKINFAAAEKYFQDAIHKTGVSSDRKCDHNEVDE